jgi:hypothetical protein
LLAQATVALTHPLSSEQVREAYFLGRDPERRGNFFSKYIHFPTQSGTGPDIHLIEFRTPYEQVALRSQEHWANYNALDAENDYATHPDQILVRVFICATQTFSFPAPPPGASAEKAQPEDYLHGFQFRVSQALPVKPEKLTVRRALLGCADFDGFEAFLQFKAEQLEPGRAEISVTTPDGRTVETEFDLDKLK